MNERSTTTSAAAYRTEEIREHMMVHARGNGAMNGSPGVHVGTVDGLEGGFIKLIRSDSPDGQHHLIPLEWVERVDGEHNTVYLNRDAEAVRREWQPDRELDASDP